MSGRSVKRFSVIFDRIIEVKFALGAVILIFIAFAVCWDVIARAFFNKPLTWVLEFSEYSLLYITFLSTTFVLKNERHVTSDLFIAWLSPRKQSLCFLFTSILGAALCSMFTWYGIVVSLEKLRVSAYQPTALEISDFPLFIIIPLGFFFLSIQFARRTYNSYAAWKGLKEEDL